MGPGGPPGLQNRVVRRKSDGGFDSLPSPPELQGVAGLRCYGVRGILADSVALAAGSCLAQAAMYPRTSTCTPDLMEGVDCVRGRVESL